MEDIGEFKTFTKVWLLAISSAFYVYLIPLRISPGISRLLSLLPVVVLFVILPLQLTTLHLTFPTFFYLVWLGNSKLLLLAFNRGPLATTPPLPLLVFTIIALFPINRVNKISAPIRASASAQTPTPALDPTLALAQTSDPALDLVQSHRPIILALKALALSIIVQSYQYRSSLNPNVILALYCCHVFLGIELVISVSTYFVRVFLGFGYEIERQFNEPYLATSLQDYWGRRWNIMATRILGLTVYNPIISILTPMFGRFWSRLPAILAAFLVSGLMHELLFFYLSRVRPTWEVTWFFVLQGVCTAVEVAVKKAVRGRFQLHRAVSGPLTVGFIAVTGVWLFLPQLIRNGVDVKAIKEYSLLVNILRCKWA